MAEKYNEDFGVRAISFFPSLDAKLALPPADKMHHRREFVIGIAGQIYATEEWARLVEALNSVKWVINGREIKIVIMGNRMFYSHIQFNEHVGFMQWGSQAETVKIMSDSDLLYCSYWFSPTFETEARLSFPSKLTTYLAAGRPVFFHGPEYASPARFLKENEAGILCHSLDKSKIINSISKIIHSPRLYAELANNGRKAFDKYLTLDTLKKSFADFLRVDENFLTGI
jgi:glycosyltransferase involved in cell wall biosynthesis